MATTVYYNEFEPYPAWWLSNLTAAGALPRGYIDTSDIRDVRSANLEGYNHCHFFAGIGGWPYALQLTGWPDDREVWTGSCPCQPFSNSGKKKGFDDDRHLWPEWFGLIKERRPATIFGEQVASPLGRDWLARVFADLEGLGYAVAGADLPAASLAAPHIRQRLFWVAHHDKDGRSRSSVRLPGRGQAQEDVDSSRTGEVCVGMAHAEPLGWGRRCNEDNGGQERSLQTERSAADNDGMGNSTSQGLEGRESEPGERSDQRLSAEAGSWSDFYIVECREKGTLKYRRVGSRVFPLVNGFPRRVEQIRAYGNAIVPQVAAVFVRAFMELRSYER